MRVDEFDFDLPEERIALTPTPARDGARLLFVPAKAPLSDRRIKDFPEILRPGDLLVLNDTRVIPAQLVGRRAARDHGGGGDVMVDVTLHKRHRDQGLDGVVWDAFVRPAKRIREGDLLDFTKPGCVALRARVASKEGGEAQLNFDINEAAFDCALGENGAPPLPPYIARKRAADPNDADRYQTVYAENAGSVAAPTAGLHFTEDLLADLAAGDIDRAHVTLHVGAGTFLPVSVEDTSAHKMHSEWGEITEAQAAKINAARAAGGRIIAVGTTALRLLESAADDHGNVHPFCAETDIFITPGYRFKIVDGLLTNFHLPRSTLFMLVCALSGSAVMKRAYAHAIDAEYRFYSYGDACFLERPPA